MTMRTGLGTGLRYLNMHPNQTSKRVAHSHKTITYDGIYASWAETQHESWVDLSIRPMEHDMAEEVQESRVRGRKWRTATGILSPEVSRSNREDRGELWILIRV